MTDGTPEATESTNDTAHLNTVCQASLPSFSQIALDSAVEDAWEKIRGFLPESVIANLVDESDRDVKNNSRKRTEGELVHDAVKNTGKVSGQGSTDVWEHIRGTMLRAHEVRGIQLSASMAKQQITPNDHSSNLVHPAGYRRLAGQHISLPSSCPQHSETQDRPHHPRTPRSHHYRQGCRRLIEHRIETHRDRAPELQGIVGLPSKKSRMSVGSDVEVGRKSGSALSMLDVAERAIARPLGAKGDATDTSTEAGERLV